MGRPKKWAAHPVLQKLMQSVRQQESTLTTPASKLTQQQGPEPMDWLALHNPGRYVWQSSLDNPRAFYRRLGIVESQFDSDGDLWEGRADLHQNLHFELETDLNEGQLRARIVLAWTLLRHKHVLLSCKAKQAHEINPKAARESHKWTDRCFVYEWPVSIEEAVNETQAQVSFVANDYPDVDVRDFFHHVMNSSRAIDSRKALSKLYVMPFQKSERGTTMIHLIPILAHQITDGLTTYRWNSSFTQIMNMSERDLYSTLQSMFKDTNKSAMLSRLPPAQEALYPPIFQPNNKVRTRWHWLLTRILRHVRRAPPPSFSNPLRRTKARENSIPLQPTYSKVLNYIQTPPLNAGSISADLHNRPAANMRRLCREADISMGSGLFTLVAITMQQFYEHDNPDIPLHERLPFVGGFPLNPRPWLIGEPTTGRENSCMLAFSDGVTLPFLPSDLDLRGRFKVLGRLAHRQLRRYQKRKGAANADLDGMVGSSSPSQLLPALYCSTLERAEGKVTEQMKAGINIQGAYPASMSPTGQTCGISSVGDVSVLLAPSPALRNNNRSSGDQEEKDLVAELKSMASVVRPRDGEFLVGAIGSRDHQGFLVAYDANAIDPEKAQEWKGVIEGLLDVDMFEGEQAKL